MQTKERFLRDFLGPVLEHPVSEYSAYRSQLVETVVVGCHRCRPRRLAAYFLFLLFSWPNTCHAALAQVSGAKFFWRPTTCSHRTQSTFSWSPPPLKRWLKIATNLHFCLSRCRHSMERKMGKVYLGTARARKCPVIT